MPAATYFGKRNAHEEGQNRGCNGVERVSDRRFLAILARNFFVESWG